MTSLIRCVLAATDGSETALAAVETATQLTVSLGPHARMHVVSVIAYAGLPGMLAKQPAGAPDLLAEQAEEALQFGAAAAFAAGVQVQTHLVAGDVVPAILACAQEVGADILVAGFHGRNRLVRLVMGGVVGNLVRATHLPVVVVRAAHAPESAG
ncbi:MAG TPA: universal stress protein [Candidatus Baltobacteraceae bacterium]|nr:universal stress protein [Candidatus Baltobacteraceae bacterium]